MTAPNPYDPARPSATPPAPISPPSTGSTPVTASASVAGSAPVVGGATAPQAPVAGPSAPGQPAGGKVYPPGQPSSPAAPPAPPALRGPGATIAIAVSVLALVVSLGTAVLAWQALDKAGDARDIALAGGSRGGTQVQPTVDTPGGGGGGAPTDAPADPAPTSAVGQPISTVQPTLDDGTNYVAKYTNETLTIPLAGCSYMYIDLHEPRVGVSSDAAELRLYPCGNTPYFRLTNSVTGSMAGTPTMSPTECNEKIRTVPLGPDQEVPARRATVLCVISSFAASVESGVDWRLARVQIAGVARDNVTLTVDSWVIPS
ncbi:hypothetical protein GCM10009682_53840 [Luedemannella flava]|uniref:Uncharacterized protein n=1 Tax=Luedemannella flava TaxID=349316 RepID=A0ABP4YUG6_9ACTN